MLEEGIKRYKSEAAAYHQLLITDAVMGSDWERPYTEVENWMFGHVDQLMKIAEECGFSSTDQERLWLEAAVEKGITPPPNSFQNNVLRMVRKR